MKSWKEVIQPRRDVQDGSFKQSDFAVDLMKVVKGVAPSEYQDAALFFERTLLTQGVSELLANVAGRLSGSGGDPVLELKTNFGGGKSHTLLAIYHLAKNAAAARSLAGVAGVLDKAGIGEVPPARVAVIDGNYRSPGTPRRESGRSIRTLWGNLAFDLLGTAGFDMVAESDSKGVAPGKELLGALLAKASPCVILLDELVAYYRQLDKPDLPGGTYDANLSFAQQLTEAVENASGAVMLATLPQSEGEAGGAWGQKALHDLGNVFHRVAATWHPVSRDEGFEIVRRRLFEPLSDETAMRETCGAYRAFYHENRAALPREAQEPSMLDAFAKCYPIHPEVFTRLYEDWATLPDFQKTRGVLQLMALAVHCLWNDPEGAEPLIMPGSLPFYDKGVFGKATQWLPGGWGAIIDAEIDGKKSAAAALDAANPQFGRLHAARRVARTVFLGSATSVSSQKVRGLDAARVMLGCAIPGEELSFYRDALEKMGDTFRFLFRDSDHWWFDTRPNLNRTVHDKADRVTEREVTDEVMDRFSAKWGAQQASGIHRVHVFESGQKVPDDVMDGLRVVVLPPSSPYSPHAEKPAFDAARDILETRGASARVFRNRIVFLAADLEKYVRTAQLCRRKIAWGEVVKDIEDKRIDASLTELESARRQRDEYQGNLEQSVGESFCHLLVPEVGPKGPSGPCAFEHIEVRTAPVQRLSDTVSAVLDTNGIVLVKWAARFLGDHLAKTYFGNADDVSVRKVWDDMARFLDYRRLASVDVLRAAIENGVRDGIFGYASGKRPDGSYDGFKFKELVMAEVGDRSCLIKASLAETLAKPSPPPPSEKCPVCGDSPCTCKNPPLPPPPPPPPPPPAGKRRFSGSVEVDAGNLSRLDDVRTEIIALLADRDLHLDVRLEIHAESDEAMSADLLRALKTNSKLLDEFGLS